jgi:hypothetical protein
MCLTDLAVGRQAGKASACYRSPAVPCAVGKQMEYTAATGSGFFTRMSVHLSRPAICGSRVRSLRTQRPASASAGQLTRIKPRDSFGPFALSLIGLAIAVALWGYSYRVSRYSVAPPSKTFVAKLWVENRLAIAAERVKARNSVKQFGAGADAVPISAILMPAPGRAAARSVQLRPRLLLRLISPTPLRSPPALLSL